MIKIRNSVFETNSSSTHSISIGGGNPDRISEFNSLGKYIDEDNYLHIKFMGFGWGYDFYCDAYTKLVYLIQMICLTHGIDLDSWWTVNKSPEHVMNNLNDVDEWEWINNYIRKWFGIEGIYIDSVDGYIDHQSYEYYRSAKDFLNAYELTIEEFLFNPNVKLIIDNDNH